MKPTHLLAAALFGLATFAADAADGKIPTQPELTVLLAGNTLNGAWDGRPFTQYFALDGSTRYREGDGAASDGTWHVTPAGQYCSVWPPSTRVDCYDVLVDDNKILWKSGGKIHPSEVVPGKRF